MSSVVAFAGLALSDDSSQKHYRQTDEAFAVTSAALATPVSSDDEGPPLKRRRVSDFTEQFSPDLPTSLGLVRSEDGFSIESVVKGHKTPQKKYEPPKAMNKEDAAAWRREQRRVRNRLSAATSRQKQKDRITELEQEVQGWKNKVDSIFSRIKVLEEASGIDSRALVPIVAPDITDIDLAGLAADVAASAAANTVISSKFVSPPVSPGPGEISPSSIDAVVDQVLGGVFEQEHSDKMISRHAVS
jgi:hypothetical protein